MKLARCNVCHNAMWEGGECPYCSGVSPENVPARIINEDLMDASEMFNKYTYIDSPEEDKKEDEVNPGRNYKRYLTPKDEKMRRASRDLSHLQSQNRLSKNRNRQ